MLKELFFHRPARAVALANSANDDATVLTCRAHRLSAAASSKDATSDDHLDAAIAHRQARDANRSARKTLTADMHEENSRYHFGKAGVSIPNSGQADSHLDQFSRDPALPPVTRTANRIIGADAETLDAFTAKPSDLNPEEAHNLLDILVQRAITADTSAKTDSSKIVTHWNRVRADNPDLAAKADSMFRRPASAIEEPAPSEDRMAACLYNSKFRELLPQFGGDAVRTHSEIKTLFPHLVPKRNS